MLYTLYKPEHVLITKARENFSRLPPGLGYTLNTGGVLELIDGLENDTLKILSNFFQDSRTSDQFLKQGYDLDILIKGYKHNFSADREKVSQNLTLEVGGNLNLAIGFDRVFNETLQEDFKRFTSNLGRNPTVSGAQAATTLDNSVDLALKVRQHTNAIRPYIKENTRSGALFSNAEKEMLTTVAHAYEFVEKLGGKVDPTIKQKFFDQTPTQSLDQAFTQASLEGNFGKLQRKPPAVVPSRLFVRNYKK